MRTRFREAKWFVQSHSWQQKNWVSSPSLSCYTASSTTQILCSCPCHAVFLILLGAPLNKVLKVLEVRQGRRGREQEPTLVLQARGNSQAYQTQQVLFGRFHIPSWHLRSSCVSGHCPSGKCLSVLLPKTQD